MTASAPHRHHPSAAADGLVAVGGDASAEARAALGQIGQRGFLLTRRPQDRLVGVVMAHETKGSVFYAPPLEHDARQHTDPVPVPAPAVSRVKREAAKPVENGLAAVELDR